MILGNAVLRMDIINGGRYRISGTVRRENTPAKLAKVLLLKKSRPYPIREQIVTGDGNYAFNNISAGTWLVLAQDLLEPNYYPDIVRLDSEPM